MTTITTGAASENGSTSADRASAEGSKHQTMRAAIKGLFKDAVKAVTRHDDEDEPQPRRKSGETEGEFRRLARYLWRRFEARQGFKTWSGITSRYVRIDPAAHAVATEYLASTLDALNQMNDGSGADYGDDCNVVSNFNSLHL